MDSYSKRFSLPKTWPQSVKTAVLHVITLAHVAIIQARRIVTNSPHARMRLAGDLQGALDEIALLQEELRIKDTRMAMIDPHRRRPMEEWHACRFSSSKPHEAGLKRRRPDATS